MIDYLVLEAIVLRMKLEDADAQEKANKAAEKKKFKTDFSELESKR